MLLADFGTGQVLWSLFYFFFFLIWIYLLFLVIADLFASHDLSGWAKAIWVAALIILPYIAVLAYLIVRGHKMQQHVAAAAAAQEIATRAYIKSVASTPVSVADELAKLADLRDRGIIDEVDFQRLKAQLVGADVAPGTATV